MRREYLTKPILNRRNKKVRFVSFRKLPNAQEYTGEAKSIEQAKITGGGSLIVYQEGCENYTERFVFEVPDVARAPHDKKYWYLEAARLLELIADSKSGLNIKDGAAALRKQARRKTSEINLNEFISVYPGETMLGSF